MSLDNYIKNIINEGDEGSRLLRAKTAHTLKNCEYVDVLKDSTGKDFHVLRIPSIQNKPP